MSEYDEMSPPGTVARVRSVNANVLYLELSTGSIARVTGDGLTKFRVGEVVLVRAEENHIEPAPQDLWPEDSWVGIVRLKHNDITIVDTNGRWRILPTRKDLNYRE